MQYFCYNTFVTLLYISGMQMVTEKNIYTYSYNIISILDLCNVFISTKLKQYKYQFDTL